MIAADLFLVRDAQIGGRYGEISALEGNLQVPGNPAARLPNLRDVFLFRKNPGERDERSQNHDGLKANRANDPLQNVGLYFGNICFEFGLKCRQIRLRGKIIMRRFPQGFGERLGLLRREMAFIPQRAGQAKGIEEKGAHPRNMALDTLKVHQRRAAIAQNEPWFHSLDASVSIRFCS